MKKVIYNKTKPVNYYNHLLTFFAFTSFVLALTLVNFIIDDFLLFLLKFIILFFLLMLISVMLEFFYRGEYISPITFYNLEHFFNKFLLEIGRDGHYEKFFNKYDFKSKKAFKEIFHKHKNKFFLSSIRKKNGLYELTMIDEIKFLEFFFIKFFVRKGVHKLYVKRIDGKFKIIRLV